MNNLILRIMSLALIISKTKDYHVYIRYYGNCDCFDVDIDMVDKHGHKKSLRNWSLYLDTMTLEQKIKEINEIRIYLEGITNE